MSIAIDEAEQWAQSRYFGSVHIENIDGRPVIVPNFPQKTNLRREGYVAGRTAEPTEAEIEAAARVLWIDEHRNSFPSMNDVEMACKESFTLDVVSSEYEDRAEHALRAARKAVKE